MPRQLLDADRQRELRRQQLLFERLSRVAERQIASEITKAMRDMTRGWSETGQVPTEYEHQRRMDSILRRIWTASIRSMSRRIQEAAKASLGPSVVKNENEWELFVQQFIADFGAQKIVDISETTRQQVLNGIAIGRREALGQSEIAKRIMEQSPTIGRHRANVIARTETHAAGNYGSLKQAESTGLQMEKEWVASGGGRTRDTHEDADGQTVPIDAPFDVGGYDLMYPGDPSGPPEEVINCRCAVAYVVAD